MTFDEVVEQAHVTTTLKNCVQSDQIGHAYLFSGTRGTGKTTMAKLLARAINCLNPHHGNPCNECAICKGILDGSILDVIEIDAASNNSVDDIRDIRDEVIYAPARAKYKVYIIDEVHMLSGGAFNALLKTLEEPPSQIVFILATTEPQKLPPTVLSRCQRYDFKRITDKGIAGRLGLIAADCEVSVTPEALLLLARLAGGALRDAISLLDQMVSTGRTVLDVPDVTELSGLASEAHIKAVCHAVVAHNTMRAFEKLTILMQEGRDIVQICAQMTAWMRNLLVAKITGNDALLSEIHPDDVAELKQTASNITREEILFLLKELAAHEMYLKRTDNPRIMLEVLIMRLSNRTAPDAEDLLERISRLEARILQLEQRPVSVASSEGSQVVPAISEKTVHTPLAAGRNTSTAIPEGVPVSAPLLADKMNSASTITSHAGSVPSIENNAGPASPSTAGTAPGFDLSPVWLKIIEAVRKMGSMKVYANLLDTQVQCPSPGVAVVLVPPDDLLKKKVLARNESTESIAAAISSIAGGSWQVKVADIGSQSGKTSEPEHDPILERLRELSEKNGIPMTIRE